MTARRNRCNDGCDDDIPADLLERYDRPGPRYTSYPTAVEFHDGVQAAQWRQCLEETEPNADCPLSVYVHVPFCARRCAFCGCTTECVQDSAQVGPYVDAVHTELDRVAALLTRGAPVAALHFGGGTPHLLDDDALGGLVDRIRDRFEVAGDAEVALEVNPSVLRPGQLEVLVGAGFNRLSVGVQDFDAAVLAAIDRHQDAQAPLTVIARARDLGVSSVNVDLVVGLPRQTRERFARTLETTVAVRPDRIALYGFAWLPGRLPHQQRIDPTQLPDRDTRFALVSMARQVFAQAGYVHIGMDHFALRTDALALAKSRGDLHRNFMGYTVGRRRDVLGLGASAISAVNGTFAQNARTVADYIGGIEREALATVRGYQLTPDDAVRQEIILSLMCQFEVRYADIEAAFGLDFRTAFGPEREQLAAQRREEIPFTEETATGLRVTPAGTRFVRNLCMVFDAHLQRRAGDGVHFSRTI